MIRSYFYNASITVGCMGGFRSDLHWGVVKINLPSHTLLTKADIAVHICKDIGHEHYERNLTVNAFSEV